MATREKWLEASGGGGLPMTSFNVEAFLGRLKCLFLRRLAHPDLPEGKAINTPTERVKILLLRC